MTGRNSNPAASTGAGQGWGWFPASDGKGAYRRLRLLRPTLYLRRFHPNPSPFPIEGKGSGRASS